MNFSGKQNQFMERTLKAWKAANIKGNPLLDHPVKKRKATPRIKRTVALQKAVKSNTVVCTLQILVQRVREIAAKS